MNAQRRQRIAELNERMSDLQSRVSEHITDLQDVINEEQDYLDAMPDSLQDGEKGQKAQAAIDLMDNLICEMSTFTDLDTDDLDTAAE